MKGNILYILHSLRKQFFAFNSSAPATSTLKCSLDNFTIKCIRGLYIGCGFVTVLIAPLVILLLNVSSIISGQWHRIGCFYTGDCIYNVKRVEILEGTGDMLCEGDICGL